jgi:outer membrane receptor protein involved in Fe transport
MKNYTTRSFGRLARICAFGLPVLAATSLIGQTNAPAATEEPTKLEAFSVTGSRIKRIDSETPQPVVRITSDDFKATGFSTLGDAIRAMPQINGQSLVSTDGGTSFTPGVSSFNLRGLGNNNTLVLINGRRAAPFASAGFNGFQTVFDFNSIPAAAIESIEVLKDGASAIYGSDAVAGVVNINLRKNYTGLTTEVSFGNTLRTDSNERSFFAILGAQSGKTSIVTTFDYQQRASIYGRDLPWTDESDGRPYGGADQRSSQPPIAGVRGLTGLPGFANGRATFLTPQANPTLANAVNQTPLYNFQELAGLTPDTRSFGFYTRATHDFSDKFTGFAELSFRRSEVFIDAAPTNYFSANELGDSAGGAGIFPATNPFNPFGQNILDIRYRFNELGNRVQESIADTARVVVGAEGALPMEGWSWDGALVYSKNTVTQLSHNQTSDRLVQNAFNGITLNGAVRYLNPFGPNDPQILNYLKITNPNWDTFEVRSADISASGPLFKLPAGEVNLALGGEVRTEDMRNIVTQLNRDGQIVGGSQGTDTVGDRRLYSAYAELNVPVMKNDKLGSLELQLAGRFESYSDFGETTKPKVAAVWRPLPEVLLRASIGESFLAPNIAFLYTSSSVSFTANSLPDPLRPGDPATQIRQFGGGNPGLQPEETDVTYGGIVLQPFARSDRKLFRELSFGVDYIKFEQTNLISRVTASQILANLAAFGNLVLRNPPAAGQTVGTINGVLTTWQNLSTAEYEAYDFNVRWVLPKNDLGQFRMDLSATYASTFEGTGSTGVAFDGDADYGFPLWRGTATLAWNKGDWAASIFATYTGNYTTAGSGLAGLPDVGEQWIVSPQFAYKGLWNSTITVGVRNIFDRAPPIDPADSKLVNENVNNVEPLFAYVRWSKDW